MSSRLKVLVVEDDEGISRFLKMTLAANDYEAIICADGKSALSIAASHCPDCILLDLGLPDIDGNAIIKSIREWSTVPVVVISARTTENDKATALDLGADDYIVKPFGTVELLARIRTALRHTRTTSASGEIALTDSFHVGGLTIDYKKRRAFVDGEDANLTPNEFRIVALLGRYAGTVLTYKHMLTELWGPSASPDNKILRVNMASIRRKLEKNPNEPVYIMTEVGVGYRMVDCIE